MAEFMEMRPVVVAMYLDEEKKLMITADTDNKIGVRWSAILCVDYYVFSPLIHLTGLGHKVITC